ncbi:hypothetical protein RRG08_021851 [Elysia crispata]|uniref:Uncharacterized protein n=1 Tax=Elysia crispata TaxID=231223 RepID=A0AAE0YFI6_9GAST|nr:hypothetical protein RRG08_021851 [Elysia crispata]
MPLFSFPSAFDHQFAVDDPSPMRFSLPSHFFNLKARFGFVYGLDKFPFPTRLYDRLYTTGSFESSNIESSLALPHLYSSKMNFIGGLSFALRQYIATSVRPGVMASRLTKYLTENGYINTSVQKGGIPRVSGCLEHATMIWEAIQRAKSDKLNLDGIWLDLANAY